MSKLKWERIPNHDGSNREAYQALIVSDKYGLVAWIDLNKDGKYEILTNFFFDKPLKVCKNLKSAKRWVAINLKSSREKEYQAIINAYDPYYQPEGAELDLTPEGMIYNLQNIRKDLNSDETTLIEAIDKFLGTYGGLK